MVRERSGRIKGARERLVEIQEWAIPQARVAGRGMLGRILLRPDNGVSRLHGDGRWDELEPTDGHGDVRGVNSLFCADCPERNHNLRPIKDSFHKIVYR